MSFLKRWGISTRRKLRKSSPFACLCIELANALTEKEFSSLKLAVGIDKLIIKKKFCTVKNSADLLHILHEDEIISPTDTHFLEHLLCQIGRKDLEKNIQKYHEKRRMCENTPPVPDSQETDLKIPASPPFTQLRPTCPDMSPGNVMKEVNSYCQSSTSEHLSSWTKDLNKPIRADLKPGRFSFPPSSHQTSLPPRDHPDGNSTSGDSFLTMMTQQDDPSPKSQQCHSSNGSLQEDGCSQMSIDSSQKSVMSISDDEKMGMISEKAWMNELDEATMSSL